MIKAVGTIILSPEENLKAVQDDVRFKLNNMKVLFSEIQEIKNAVIRENV